MAERHSPNRKVLASLTLPTTAEIWKEHNAKVFSNNHAPSMIILYKIKKEACLWFLAGAKCLGDLMLG
jgi:hypothetical protein